MSVRGKSRAGDWYCAKCQDLNFTYRTNCRKCGQTKGNQAKGGQIKAKEVMANAYATSIAMIAGDWNCLQCNELNFKRRTQCRKCECPKGMKKKPYKFVKEYNETDEHFSIRKAKHYIYYNNLEALKQVFQESNCNKNILIKSKSGTALHLACENGYLELVDYMLEVLNMKDYMLSVRDGGGGTIFEAACRAPNLDSLKVILKHVGDSKFIDEYLNSPGTYLDTPLHIACRWERVDIVKFLLTYDSVVDRSLIAQNDRGDTPLHVTRSFECAKILMSHTQVREIGLNIKNREGDTPLHAIWSVNADIAKLLLENSELIRPSIDVQNNYGKTLLHLRYKSEDLFQILCRDHREIVMNMLTIRDRYGNTPIHSASHHGCTLLLDFLIKQPSVLADALNVTNNGGETPLHLACWRSGKDCVKRLLEEPTVIEKCLNAQELNGYTPLIFAVKYGGGGCVECLLEIPGLDIEIKTKKGRSACEYMYKVHDASVRNMLQEHIARARNTKLA